MAKRIESLPELNPFSKSLPKAKVQFVLLILSSMLMGVCAVFLTNIGRAGTYFLLVNGALTGMLVIALPALLTIILVKSLRMYIKAKYIFFVTIIGALLCGAAIIVGNALYAWLKAQPLAIAAILAGNAGIFAWWFFVDKLLLGQHKKAVLLAVVQPTLDVLLYIPYSRFVLSFGTPLSILLVKLYAGIAVFLVVSYIITFMLEKPVKSRIGMHSMDAFSLMLQNWLFGINVSNPFGANFGTPSNVMTQTLVMKNEKGAMKAIFFIPDVHYGPAGTLGGSNFSCMLEHHAVQKYKVPSFVMHGAVNIDNNPVSVNQLGQLKQALDNGVANCRQCKGKTTYSACSHNSATVERLCLGDVNIFTLTRAPRVTEDISPASAHLFKTVLETKFGNTTLLVDAHNSRYESAPKEELAGVGPRSRIENDFSNAIKRLDGAAHSTNELRAGFASVELYNRLGRPLDVAGGNLNAAIFGFNGFKYALLQFNANNILPQLRTAMLDHIKKRYNVDAEILTTDTHAVNSFSLSEDNELGKHTGYAKLEPAIDAVMGKAIADMEPIRAYHGSHVMERFLLWGPNTLEKLTEAVNSLFGIIRIAIPLLVAAGFIVAAWTILLI
jgi:predicted neutral ceramidase superfamily lipid hydrolase